MFYLTSKFHDDSVNTFGFVEGGELLKPLPPRSRNSEKAQAQLCTVQYLPYKVLQFCTSHTKSYNSVPPIPSLIILYLPYQVLQFCTYRTNSYNSVPSIQSLIILYLPYKVLQFCTYHTKSYNSVPPIQSLVILYFPYKIL